MSEVLEERVRQFLVTQMHYPAQKIRLETTLFGDMRTDGDDADYLFEAFGREFKVDLSELDLTRHFGPEGCYPWAPIYWLVLSLRHGTPEERARLEPITVRDLIRAATMGRWTYLPPDQSKAEGHP